MFEAVNQRQMGDQNKTPKQVSAGELYAAIRRGDEAAFGYYYSERALLLVTRIERVVRDRDEAWNLAQDTFIKLWENRDKIDPARSLDALLLTMGTNAALDALRRRQTHGRYVTYHGSLTPSHELAADAHVLARETQRRIDHIIASMPPQRRRVYEMNKIDGLTYNEIAQVTGLSTNTVRNYIATASEQMRELLMTLVACALFPLIK